MACGESQIISAMLSLISKTRQQDSAMNKSIINKAVINFGTEDFEE